MVVDYGEVVKQLVEKLDALMECLRPWRMEDLSATDRQERNQPGGTRRALMRSPLSSAYVLRGPFVCFEIADREQRKSQKKLVFFEKSS